MWRDHGTVRASGGGNQGAGRRRTPARPPCVRARTACSRRVGAGRRRWRGLGEVPDAGRAGPRPPASRDRHRAAFPQGTSRRLLPPPRGSRGPLVDGQEGGEWLRRGCGRASHRGHRRRPRGRPRSPRPPEGAVQAASGDWRACGAGRRGGSARSRRRRRAGDGRRGGAVLGRRGPGEGATGGAAAGGPRSTRAGAGRAAARRVVLMSRRA